MALVDRQPEMIHLHIGRTARTTLGPHPGQNDRFFGHYGGHLESIAADVLYDGLEFAEIRAIHIKTKNTHGSGCIFASAIAANLAKKKTIRESVIAAKDFITAAILGSLAIGKGYGPANPMAVLYEKAGVDS